MKLNLNILSYLTFFILILNTACSSEKKDTAVDIHKNENTKVIQTDNNVNATLSATEKKSTELTPTESFKTLTRNETMATETKALPEINQIMIGHVKSGTHGGSLPDEIFETVYNYSHFKLEDNSGLEATFKSLMDDYLDNSMVNNTISLKGYLSLVQDKKELEINKIHEKHSNMIAKGAAKQDLPTLLFSKNNETPLFTLNRYYIEITSPSQNKLFQFVIDNGVNFSSSIPDSLYKKYYQ